MSTSGRQIDAAYLQAFNDAWNRHDIEALMAFMTDDCQFHGVAGPDLLGRGCPVARPRVQRRCELVVRRRVQPAREAS